MPKRSQALQRQTVPLLAACLTLFYAGGIVYFSFFLAWQTAQTQRARDALEARQIWEQLRPLSPLSLGEIEVVRQSSLILRVTSLAFSPSGRYLAAGSDAAEVTVFDTQTHQRLAQFFGHRRYVLDVAFSPDGNVVASASADGTVKLWDVSEKRLLNTLYGHTDQVTALAFSPQGALLVSGALDKTLRFWDWRTGRVLNLSPLEDGVGAIAFSPDGQFVAAGMLNSDVWLFPSTGGSPLCRWKHGGGVTDIRFSPQGSLVLSAGASTISEWKVEDCSAGATFSPPNSKAVGKIALSPDGRLLVAAGGDWREPRLWIWSLPDGTAILESSLPASAEAIREVVFSPDGRVFLTGSHDALIRWWGVK